MKRWFLTGGAGMLGTDLTTTLEDRGDIVVRPTIEELDITDQRAITAAIREARPDFIVNCAAYTAVDAAEGQESIAMAVNGSAVEHLAHAADETGALLVQISTDFVFDGTKTAPYEVNDAPNPLSAYGRTKLQGEAAAARTSRHAIIRTSWLFGVNGPNFVEAIRRQIGIGTNPLRVVADQRGRPTYTPHLAHAVVRIASLAAASADARGIVHYADEGACSWFEFAQAIAEECGSDVSVVPVTTAEFPRPAVRPAYSVLSTERYERLTGAAPESWREGLREYFELRPSVSS